MAKLDLTAQFAAQMQGRHFGPQAPEAYDKPTNIVVAGNGIFRVVKTPIALFTSKITDIPAANRLPGLPDMQEGPELLIPKIPLKYLVMVLTWYREVYEQDKTEASILFFWNHADEEVPTMWEPTQIQKNAGLDGDPIKGLVIDGKLIVYCPQQKNSSSLSEFHEDTMVAYLREHFTPLCETHSHHTMGAFWSATDNANENMTQFYGVWGNILQNEPNFLFRWVSGNSKVDIDPSILFDIPQIEKKTVVTTTIPIPGVEAKVEETVEYSSFKGPWPRIETPEEWMGQHRKSWGGYSGGYNYGKKQTGGTTASPPSSGTGSGSDAWADEQLYREWAEFGADADKFNSGKYQTEATGEIIINKKKEGNETRSNNSNSNTTVQIFLGKEVSETEKGIDEIEETVHDIISQLIELGYDYVISDTMQEESGYAIRYND